MSSERKKRSYFVILLKGCGFFPPTLLGVELNPAKVNLSILVSEALKALMFEIKSIAKLRTNQSMASLKSKL